MTELMHFQPGKALYDAYQQGRGNYLAGQAFNSQGDQRQSALGQLAGLNPDKAMALKADFDEQDKADFTEFSNVILNAPEELKPQIYAKGVQRFGHKIRALGVEPPTDYRQALPLFEQLAKATGGNQQAPVKIQEAQWFAAQQNLKPGTQEYADFVRRYSGASGNYTFADDPATGKIWRRNNKTGQMELVEANGGVQQQPQGGTTAEVPVGLVDSFRQEMGRDPTIAEINEMKGVILGKEGAGYHFTSNQGAPAPTQTQQPSYVGMSEAEKARAKAQAAADVELGYAGQIEAAKATGKAQVESIYGPQIASASAQATEEGKARGQRAATGEKKVAEAGDAIALLKEAEQLLAVATGGYVGAKADEFAAAFNKSSKGAEANAQLNVIAPKLIGLVPRFEGPQSDADRRLYENAAGDLGNPNKPVSVRLAAARMMMKMYQQTANKKQAADGQPKRIRITL